MARKPLIALLLIALAVAAVRIFSRWQLWITIATALLLVLVLIWFASCLINSQVEGFEINDAGWVGHQINAMVQRANRVHVTCQSAIFKTRHHIVESSAWIWTVDAEHIYRRGTIGIDAACN